MGLAPYYLLLSNFAGTTTDCTIENYHNDNGSPVFSVSTVIGQQGSTATFTAAENISVVNTLKFFIQGSDVEAIQAEGNPDAIYLLNLVKGDNRLTVNAFTDDGRNLSKEITLSTKVLKVDIENGILKIED